MLACGWVTSECLEYCRDRGEGSEAYKRGGLLAKNLTQYRRTSAYLDSHMWPPPCAIQPFYSEGWGRSPSGKGGLHNGCEASLAPTKAPTPVPSLFGARGETEAQ